MFQILFICGITLFLLYALIKWMFGSESAKEEKRAELHKLKDEEDLIAIDEKIEDQRTKNNERKLKLEEGKKS